MDNDKFLLGLTGTAVGATGAGLSVNEIQAIISIIFTVLGFTISVLIPLIIKICKQIKQAKEDGKITKEEMKDIVDTGKEIVDKTGSFIKEVSEKSEGDKK